VLVISGMLRQRLGELSDFHLGRVLDHEVCSNLSVVAPELTVCMEAAERLGRPDPTCPRQKANSHKIKVQMEFWVGGR
jgi:hypothetical protein